MWKSILKKSLVTGLFLGLFCFIPWVGGSALAMTEDERNNIDLYERLAPGVVNITSTVMEHDFFFNVVPREGAGSGSVIESGLVEAPKSRNTPCSR